FSRLLLSPGLHSRSLTSGPQTNARIGKETMPEQSPRPSAAERNLLFGILAFQMDFISRDALVRAMHAWVLEKVKPLAQLLQEQGALSAEHRAMLEPLVKAHIRAHHNDPRQSLGAVSSIGSVREELEQLADHDLHASLARVSESA